MPLPEYLIKFSRETASVGLCAWGVGELLIFKGVLEKFQGNDERSYSASYQALYREWYDYIHTKLNEFDFINGKPEENTWQKRPKAVFWWGIYCTAPQHYFPYYDHHCSSKQRLEQMLCMLADISKELIANAGELKVPRQWLPSGSDMADLSGLEE